MNTAQVQYYTFYLLNGKRKVFLGVDPQDAYTNNQSYSDGQQAIMMIDEGITDSYYWKDDTWVKKGTLQVPDITVAGLGKATIRNITPEVFNENNEITYTFHNKDQLILTRGWGLFIFGWTQYLEISYAEYQAGTYGDYDNDVQDECHYLICGSQYFEPSELDVAIETFLFRSRSSKPYNSVSAGEISSLGEIHSNQSFDAIYTDLNNQQQVILLGSLIKRLELSSDIHNCIKKGFITRPDAKRYPILHDIYQQIQYYADRYLITSDGQRDYGNEGILTKLFSYQFTTGSSDAFGPLSAVIKTQAGKLVYG